MSSLNIDENVDESKNTFSKDNTDDQIETFDMFGDIVTPSNLESPQDINPFGDVSNDRAEEIKPGKISDQINNVREVIEEIEKSGFRVEKEEYDFEDMYQITIKIKK